MKSRALLKVEKLTKHFGGITAVNQVSIDVDGNSIVGIIGPNGSGKTTLFNLITGIYKPDEGDIYFKGERITGLEPFEVFQKGISRTFQLIRLFSDMSVLENLMMAPKNQMGEK